MQLLQAGALWHLLFFMFKYDFTLEEGGVERSEDANQQEVENKLAKLAVHACARLGGYLSGDMESPTNPVTRDVLSRLLTPYLARQLSLGKPEEILKTLNGNCETPYLLWDNGTRAELREFLELESRFGMDKNDPSCGIDFVYSAHSKELVVGEIFVRIYNQQPTYPIENPKGFSIDLLEFLGSQSEHLNTVGSISLSPAEKERIQHVIMSLEALCNVIKNNPGVEIQCIGHFRLLFGLLAVDSCKPVQRGTLNVIASVTRNQECVNDIAALMF
ncbi:hypothetical protein L9F63_001912 [Diploptera punctata]|uniref:Uncharacterized protein n=1 Tax=Diploptera punctata TaxID=6984 RepID=A0AAD8A383_DIPPU|nr:hypothetical protein L9F63_001912 [Diploptera punctata]